MRKTVPAFSHACGIRLPLRTTDPPPFCPKPARVCWAQLERTINLNPIAIGERRVELHPTGKNSKRYALDVNIRKGIQHAGLRKRIAHLEKDGAVDALRTLAGPADVEIAQALRPSTLRVTTAHGHAPRAVQSSGILAKTASAAGASLCIERP